MDLAGKTVLVTGAGGFIGSHLTETLVEMGAEVRAFIHYNANSRVGWLEDSAQKNHIRFFFGDVRDLETVIPALKDADAVFHLAALIGIPYSYVAPRAYVETNVTGTVNLLQAARQAGVSRFIHVSTSEVYGSAQYVPMDENHPLHAQSPYSASKIAADKMAEAYHLSFSLPVVTIRPFNTYGPRQSARAVLPTIITQALYSDQIRLGSLSPIRDFNYVGDTVQGFIRLAEADAMIGRTVNIASGAETTIGDAVRLVLEILGRDMDVVTQSDRVRPENSEVSRLFANIDQAEKNLCYHPQVTLRQGLEHTIEFIRRHGDRYRTGEYAV